MVETCIAANPLMHILLLGLKVGPAGLCLGCSGRPTRVARLYIVTLVRRSVGAFPPRLDRPTTKEHTEPARRYNRPGKRVTWPSHDADKPGIRPHVVAHGLQGLPLASYVRPYG